jgi:hypothetical protein
VLGNPVAAAVHDRFIVRRASPAVTVAGGEILAIEESENRPPRKEILGKLVAYANLFERVDPASPEGMLKPDGYPMQRPKHAMLWANPQQAFLRARANSIEGGTTEIAKNILGYLPAPNTATPGQGYSSLNFFLSGGDNAGQNSVYSFTTKIDQNIGDKNRVFFRFGWNEFTYEDSSNGIRGRPGVNGDWGQKKINHAYVADWVGSLTPTFIANIRTAFNRFQWDVKMLPNANFDITSLGFPKSLDAQLPIPGWFGLYSFSGYMSMGRYFYINHTNNFSVQPNITKIQGAHAIKAGLDLRWIQYASRTPGVHCASAEMEDGPSGSITAAIR